MEIKIINNMQDCENLWKIFSPNRTLWDLWDVVHSLYDAEWYIPHFMVLLDRNSKGNMEEKGLLPLWFSRFSNEYDFFGGSFPENRHFWFEESAFGFFLENMPSPTVIYEINARMAEQLIQRDLSCISCFERSDFRYSIDLKGINGDIKEYLSRFNRKHRKNLLYDIRKIEQLNYSLSWETTEHFDDFVKFSVQRFKEDSDFSDDYSVKSMAKLLDFLKGKGMLHSLAVSINGKVEGVEFGALHNGVYYLLNGGNNEEIDNLGKLMIFEHIKNSIRLNASKIDFMAGDSGWKELWNSEKQEYYTFKKV